MDAKHFRRRIPAGHHRIVRACQRPDPGRHQHDRRHAQIEPGDQRIRVAASEPRLESGAARSGREIGDQCAVKHRIVSRIGLSARERIGAVMLEHHAQRRRTAAFRRLPHHRHLETDRMRGRIGVDRNG